MKRIRDAIVKVVSKITTVTKATFSTPAATIALPIIPQAIWPLPSSTSTGPILHRKAYILQYDVDAKIPIWVSYILSPPHLIRAVERSNSFHADIDLQQNQRSEIIDYEHSGYDKGHIGDDADMAWDAEVEHESFLMSNMCPQLPGLNRESWEHLEAGIRHWVEKLNQDFTIYAGPLYEQNSNVTIGESKVTVPHAFFKIVINNQSNDFAGWLFPHKENLGDDMTKLRIPVSDIEKLSNLTIPLPNNAKELDTIASFGNVIVK